MSWECSIVRAAAKKLTIPYLMTEDWTTAEDEEQREAVHRIAKKILGKNKRGKISPKDAAHILRFIADRIFY